MNTTQSSGCGHCEIPPVIAQGTFRLFLWLPIGHTQTKLLRYLEQQRQQHQLLPSAQCLTITLHSQEISSFITGVEQIMTSEEMKSTRALLMPGAQEPGLSDMARMRTLHQFCVFNTSHWLVDMLVEERFTCHFQPIVSAQDTRQIQGYEALLRGVDGEGRLIKPLQIFKQARDADLLFQVDLAARQCAIRSAAQYQIHVPVFINFSPNAIYDPTFCLRSTMRLIRELGLSAQNIVFEVNEAEHVQNVGHLQHILNFYRKTGFRVALDDLGAGYASLNLIHQLRPDIIKLDKELIRDVHRDTYKAVLAQKIFELANQLNLQTVAEGIETPEELAWVRAHGATLVQGYLIARPAAHPMLAPAPLLA
jgi:EAL domain-containing protein (putative c-di-GMP-specific phosphodiesterase class I)